MPVSVSIGGVRSEMGSVSLGQKGRRVMIEEVGGYTAQDSASPVTGIIQGKKNLQRNKEFEISVSKMKRLLVEYTL